MTEKAFASYFGEIERCQKNHVRLFATDPIFAMGHQHDYYPSGYKRKIYYNPLLRPYEFAKLFGPYQAYQELSMSAGSPGEAREAIAGDS